MFVVQLLYKFCAMPRIKEIERNKRRKEKKLIEVTGKHNFYKASQVKYKIFFLNNFLLLDVEKKKTNNSITYGLNLRNAKQGNGFKFINIKQ